MSKPDLHNLYPSLLDAKAASGYWDGRRSESPEPGSNRHPAYIHGFRNGRDDALCSKGKLKFSSRTAQECREDWAFIEATCGEDT